MRNSRGLASPGMRAVTNVPSAAGKAEFFLLKQSAHRGAFEVSWRSIRSLTKSTFFIYSLQLGPLRNVPETAEIAGCLSAAGLVLILALCLSVYGSAQFQSTPTLGVKTLSGRSVARDPLFSADG